MGVILVILYPSEFTWKSSIFHRRLGHCRTHLPHFGRYMSELLARSLKVMDAAAPSAEPLEPEEGRPFEDRGNGSSSMRPMSMRNMSGPLGAKVWNGWAAFWVSTLLENMGTILSGLIFPELAVISMNDGVDLCAGAKHASPSCLEATAKATEVASTFGTIGAICSFFCIPLVGTAADHFGRRPLLIFSFLCSKVPTLTLLSVAYFGVSIYYFFAALMITAMVPSTMLFWFWINDCTAPDERVRMFGRLSAFSNLEGIVTPFAVILVRDKSAVLLLASIRLAAVLTVICFVPESRPPAALRSSFCASGRLAFLSRWQGVSKLCSDKSLRSFLPLAFLAAGTGAGLNAIAFYYCKARFGLVPETFAPYVSVSTLSNFFVQIFLIQPLSRVMGLRGLFAFSLGAGVLTCIAYALIPSPGWLILVSGLGGLSNVGLPAIQALMSNLSENIPGMTPGVALGALQAVQSLIMILVPPFYLRIYAYAARHTGLLFLPYLVGGFCNLLCLAALFCIPKSFFPRSDWGLPELRS